MVEYCRAKERKTKKKKKKKKIIGLTLIPKGETHKETGTVDNCHKLQED